MPTVYATALWVFSFLAELRELGCTASAVAGSVADFMDVNELCPCAGRRLTGVVQLSMGLRDKPFRAMTIEDWSAALAPKLAGTWNLHKTLQGMELGFLALFGSNVSWTGKIGQTNHSAANSFLESFAGYRRQQGLACSVIRLGPVEDIGVVSENPKILQRAREHAIRLLGENEVMEALALATRQSPVCKSSPNDPYSSIVGLGTSKPTTDPLVVPIWDGDARFGMHYGMDIQGEQTAVIYKDRIKMLFTLELGNLMTEYMPSAADMDEEQIANMKIDSLMAIETKSAIRRSLGVDITLGEINKAETVRRLSQLAISHMKIKYADGRAAAS
ncbi:KR domain-containing protein [Aspergillus recurvatus]